MNASRREVGKADNQQKEGGIRSSVREGARWESFCVLLEPKIDDG